MSAYLSPDSYLPHDAPMLLLEQVIEVSDTHAHCRVSVCADGVLAPFLDDDGNLPGWYALELIAQTVGVWSGWHRLHNGDSASSLGMVLGARDLRCSAGLFTAGAILDITVQCLMQDARLASFDGTIACAGETLAHGRVTTFQPTEAELSTLFQQGLTS
ncbi:3-hydroxy-fatty acyl-ACP dehydratase [Pluralibacter sp.]|uniref:ApeP family dehydratase n=1 Tax=Pluralibacter sp. TaxID=1920032 RepID=UPI0025E2BC2F|nr:3-hydroxy-fatty acyl-ACP dehydratase [Pluralibacter sp.]MBV8042768.1 3-hydroxy-fatty acyl-ACP dehydratase [Pluralibacter sp.]